VDMCRRILTAALVSVVSLGAWMPGSAATVGAAHAAASGPDPAAVVKHYANLAQVSYEDALSGAVALQRSIERLLERPSEETLKMARQAWLTARIPYMQTEVFRFGNPIVDDWEGRVNAWPLDEGMIDYVDESYGTESDTNAYYVVNVIANRELMIGGKRVDASVIDADLLRNVLHEADGNEANVATGWHAIEFLLWGQDLNGTGPAPAGRTGTPQERHSGNRPYTDFDVNHCTGGNCDRRAQYLKVVADLLVQDLSEMVAHWREGGRRGMVLQREGAARTHVTQDARAGLIAMLTGMGSLSYGELAGERMKLGLMLHDPEEEHDCFSDNTHNSHYYNQVGIMNVYLGRYGHTFDQKTGGALKAGASLSELVAAKNPALDREVKQQLDATLAALAAIKQRAETLETYDQMIAQGNTQGNAVVQAGIDALIAQTRSLERVMAALDLGSIELEGSDSLDNPEAVFQ